MLGLLLHSGLYNGTVWLVLVALVVAAVRWRRRTDGPWPPAAWLSTAALTLLAVVTLVNVSYGVFKGLVAPRDIMQDIVSAQEYLAGRSLYPADMTDRIRLALEREPPPAPLAWSDSLHRREQEALQETLDAHWVQAHPPLMTLAMAPLVAGLGVTGTYLAVTAISLVCLAGVLWLLRRELAPGLPWRVGLLITLAILGWDDLIILLRAGQPGLLLAALTAVGWLGLRHDRPWLAGLAIGTAAAVKVFPGLLLFYLLLRHRKAFLVSLATLAGWVVLTGSLAGWDSFREHLLTAQSVVQEYADYPGNLSLLATVARFEGPAGAPHPVARLVFYAAAVVILVAVAWLVRRNSRQGGASREVLDLEFGLLMTLMVMLSPVAWDHYLPLLLLPLAVLGRHVFRPVAELARVPVHGTTGTLASSATGSIPPGRVVLLLALLFVLVVPDTAYTTLMDLAPAGALRFLGRLLLLPLRTYILAGVCFWLVRLTVRTTGEMPTSAPLRLASLGGPAALFVVLGSLVAAHLAVAQPPEPYFNNDETRHVMTGVYFRDLLCDLPTAGLRDYTVRYYLQYPALGLLVWPPLFYAVEGVAMLAFGPSFDVARGVVAGFALMACVYLFLLARRTHGTKTAVVAVLLFGLSPLVFLYSHHVMLEMPTLALVLAALFHADRYLSDERRSDLAACGVAAALAALTRFDAVLLAPLFLLLLIGRRRLGVLRRPTVLLTAALAVLAVAPVYYLTAREFGGAHLKAVRDGTDPTSPGFLAWSSLGYYPAVVPEQLGWPLAVVAVVGLGLGLLPSARVASWPYLATIAAVYLTFTPMGELEPRHAMYWVPALCVLAAAALRRLASLVPLRLAGPALAAVLVGVTAWGTLRQPVRTVQGYEEAARYVLANTDDPPVVLFDGFLNGGFIYQARRLDPDRRLWVLRGDKLLYGMLSEPHAGYEEWVRCDQEVLDNLAKYDPELIVVEEPQIHFELPAATLLRATLKAHPERFRLERIIPLTTDHPVFRGGELHVYRNLCRSDTRAVRLEVKMLGLGKSLTTEAPR